jgi:hypothetical protein
VVPDGRSAEALVTRRSAVTQAWLASFFPLIGFLDFPKPGVAVTVTRVVVLVVAAGLLVMLHQQRSRPRLLLFRAAFVIANLPLLPMFWFVAHERGARGLPLELFLRENVAAFVVALLSPPYLPVSVILIVALTLQSFVLSLEGVLPIEPHTLEHQPWTSLVIGAAAILLAFYRVRRRREDVRSILVRARVAGLEHLTRSFLAVRDLANTPLQNLELSISLLEHRSTEAHQLAVTMARSVRRLRELNKILATRSSSYDGQGAVESFDPLEVLGEGPPPR